MKIWVYVEGKSDELGLMALWNGWQVKLKDNGWNIKIIRLDGKEGYLRKIGHRAAEKLTDSEGDIVVGLPDLYPNNIDMDTRFRHQNLQELEKLQETLVREQVRIDVKKSLVESCMERFYPTALKHDLEMLLLASEAELRKRLKTSQRKKWGKYPENQNQENPPKKVVRNLFQQHLNREYRETVDAPAVLRKANLREVVMDGEEPRCPVFRGMLDWVGDKTGVAAY